MAKILTEKGRAFRRLVVELDGDQDALAIELGISKRAVQARLYTQLHRAWWESFKKARSKRRARERRARARERARERARSNPPRRW